MASVKISVKRTVVWYSFLTCQHRTKKKIDIDSSNCFALARERDLLISFIFLFHRWATVAPLDSINFYLHILDWNKPKVSFFTLAKLKTLKYISM
jgi:hypothetical protein